MQNYGQKIVANERLQEIINMSGVRVVNFVMWKI